MRRWILALLTFGASSALVALGACGADSGSPFDASVRDADADANVQLGSDVECVADFPCFSPFQCADNSRYVPMQTADCHVRCGPRQCTGNSCEQSGPPVDCPDATFCITIAPPGYQGPACAPHGDSNCLPGDAATFDAGAGPYAKPGQDVCSTQDLTDFVAACFHGGACATYQSDHKACSKCLWGNVLTSRFNTGFGGLNVPGCLALATGDTSPTSCAARRAASESCVFEMCQSCASDLPPGNSFALKFVAACVANARATSCSGFVKAECAAPDGGPTAVCYETNLDAFVVKAGALFCSSGG